MSPATAAQDTCPFTLIAAQDFFWFSTARTREAHALATIPYAAPCVAAAFPSIITCLAGAIHASSSRPGIFPNFFWTTRLLPAALSPPPLPPLWRRTRALCRHLQIDDLRPYNVALASHFTLFANTFICRFLLADLSRSPLGEFSWLLTFLGVSVRRARLSAATTMTPGVRLSCRPPRLQTPTLDVSFAAWLAHVPSPIGLH